VRLGAQMGCVASTAYSVVLLLRVGIIHNQNEPSTQNRANPFSYGENRFDATTPVDTARLLARLTSTLPAAAPTARLSQTKAISLARYSLPTPK
jgi:hypothetical protein